MWPIAAIAPRTIAGREHAMLGMRIRHLQRARSKDSATADD
jgi:hypothetical protein